MTQPIDGRSTSAQLRGLQDDYQHTRAALAASQATATRMREERDLARDELNEMVARKMRMQRDLYARLAEALEQLANLRRAAREHDLLKAELASARTEIEQLRARIEQEGSP